MSDRVLKPLFWAIGGVLLVVGLIGWYQQFTDGLEQSNLGSVVTWGMWVGVYIYLVGLSAGAFLISALVYVFNVKRYEAIGRIALFAAVVTLLMALLIVWADIGHMERAWHVFAYPNFQSPMTWMLFLYTAYFLLVVTELWLVLRRDLVIGGQGTGAKARFYRIVSFGSKNDSEESATRDGKIVRVLGTIGVPVAVLFHGGVGALFAVVAARPGWNSGLFPILFLISALTSGAALLVVVTAVFQEGWRRHRDTIIGLGRLVLALLVVEVIFLASEMLVAGYGTSEGHVKPLELIISGPYWWVFWIWQLGLGIVIPIVMLASAGRRDPRWVSFAGLLIAMGFIGVRLNIVIPSMATEEIEGIANAIDSTRITTDYFPASVEWLLAAGVFGIGLLLFGLGEALMPRAREEDSHVRA